MSAANAIDNNELGPKFGGHITLGGSVSDIGTGGYDNRLGEIFAALPAGVVGLDATGHVTECNRAARELLGEPLLGERWRAVIDRAVEPGSSGGPDVALRSGRLVSIQTAPLASQAGQLLLFYDVTDKHFLQMRLDAQERAITLGKVAASLAHQIRTPLSTALLYTGTLLETGVSAQVRHGFIEKIHQRLSHVESLTAQMLSYTRGLRRGNDSLAPESLLAGVIEGVVAKMAPLTVDVETRTQPELPFISCSKDLLTTALFNLVINAIQAGGARTKVTLSARSCATGGIEFEVADDGPGIPEELRAHIFDPFFTTRTDGNGLGLTVARDVAIAHGGTLLVESKAGEGARLILSVSPPNPGYPPPVSIEPCPNRDTLASSYAEGVM